MSALVGVDAAQEFFQPLFARRVLWPLRSHVLADLWPENLDAWIFLMHGKREGDKCLRIFGYRELSVRLRVGQQVWLVSNRPVFDRMEGSLCICSCPLNALVVIHVVY